MSSLKLLSASSILDAVEDRELLAEDLIQGSSLFLHMLDSLDPILTECGASVLRELLAAGAISLDTCHEQLLRTIQHATSSISNTLSVSTKDPSSRMSQSEKRMVATLHHALAALKSSRAGDKITPATVPVLLDVLKLQTTPVDFWGSWADVMLPSGARGLLVLAQKAALSMLCDFAADPACTAAVVKAGVVGVLLDQLQPDSIRDDFYDWETADKQSTAARALQQLATTAQGARAIAAAPGSIRTIIDTVTAAYTRQPDDHDDPGEYDDVLESLSQCLVHLAQHGNCSEAIQAAGGVPSFIRDSMVSAGLMKQQAHEGLHDTCHALYKA